MYKILVVDDHELIRLGVCRLLGEVPDAMVVAQAASGEEAINLVGSHAPDVVFMDLRMPGIGGAEATRKILNHYSDVKVIILTAINDDEYPMRMLRAGASAYMTKRADSNEVSLALQKVMAGEVYISPELAQQMVVHQSDDTGDSPFASLSRREMEVALMIASGRRATEIAAIFNVSAKTVNTHKYRAYDKIKVHNDVELTLAAVKYGFIDPHQIL